MGQHLGSARFTRDADSELALGNMVAPVGCFTNIMIMCLMFFTMYTQLNQVALQWPTHDLGAHLSTSTAKRVFVPGLGLPMAWKPHSKTQKKKKPKGIRSPSPKATRSPKSENQTAEKRANQPTCRKKSPNKHQISPNCRKNEPNGAK